MCLCVYIWVLRKKIKLILECLEHLQKIDETLFFQTSISSISSNYNLHKISL